MNAMFPLGSLLLRVASYTTVETVVEGRWLQCNGAAVSRTTYAALFAHFNAQSPALPFGAGDASTFNLPDLRGRMPVGEGEHANVDSMGDSDGAAIADRQVAHYHTAPMADAGPNGLLPAVGANVTPSASAQYTSPVPFVNGRSSAPGYIKDNPAFLVCGSWFVKYVA